MPLFLVITLIVACDRGAYKNYHPSRDSLLFDTAKIDTSKPKKVLGLSQQKIAYKGLRFGMPRQSFRKFIKNSWQKIGDYEYLLSGEYNEKGELYMLTISSLATDASHLDNETHEKMNNLVDVIVAKYGDPTTTAQYPPIYSMQAGYISWVDTWIIGTKTIDIGVGENYESPLFYTECRIYDQPMSDAFDEYNSKKASKRKKVNASDF